MKLHVTSALLALALSACSSWSVIDSPRVASPDGSIAIEAPVGWIRATDRPNRVVITRDGEAIQFIDAVHAQLATAFPRTKQLPATGMLPRELAERLIAEMKADPALAHLQVKWMRPATVGGHSGFALHIEYSDARGVSYERLIYGVATRDALLVFAFNALSPYHFQRDRKTFEALVASYRGGR